MANWFSKNWQWVVPVAAVVLLVFWFIGSYNGLVRADVSVDTAWGQVQSVYQRRADLVPNLIETVKGIRDFEKETFLAVTEARSRWQGAATPQEQVAATNQLESAIGRLLVVVENYPQLRSNENFLALQDELAGTENRINVERQRYNDAVGAYNKKVRVFPTVVVASLFGFEKREFFESEAGAENVPTVDFG
jgi:LemA protein